MSYTHNNRAPIVLTADPVDPNSTDWIYFTYQNWLRSGESITTHSASIVGGTMVTASTPLGTVDDADGVSYTNVFGVQFSVSAGSTEVKISHRVTTTTTGAIDLGRKSMDHTVIIPVRHL